MASLDINTRIIENINGDSIERALNEIIDSELSKDISQMNTELVDSCVNALLEIEKEQDANFAVLIPLMSSKEFLRRISPAKISWKSLNTFTRAGLVAALIASTTLTANAAYENVTGVNIIENIGNTLNTKLKELGVFKDDEQENNFVEITKQDSEETTAETEEVTTQAVKQLYEPVAKPQIIQLSGEDDEEEETTTKGSIEQFNGEDDDDTTETTTRRKPEPTSEKPVAPQKPTTDEEAVLESLSAEYDDSFKLDYIYGEELSYEGLKLSANYSDGTRKPVELSDCSYTKSLNMNVTADYTLRIIYQTCVIKINITVRPDEETRGAEICSDDLYDYMLTKKGAYITKYKGNETNINLDTLNGSKVIAIGAGVFREKSVESISAENCEKLYDNAFKDCENLETCYTPRVKHIGSSAFENDKKLKTPVFSNDLSYIGTAAYKNSGITELTLTEEVGDIPDELCENCADLTVVDLRGAEAVGKSAFSECTSLTRVSGTEGLKKADDFAFYNCSNAEFDEKPSNLTSAGNNAFAYCNSIEFGKLYITEVEKYSFAYCHKLLEVEIDGNVKVIPEGSFRGTHLETLTLNEGTREIDDTAFMSTSITKVELPSSLTRIGTYGLYSIRLREVYTTRSLRTIEESAFFRSRLTMYVYENSHAHTYAFENNINYVLIEENSEIVQLEGNDD